MTTKNDVVKKKLIDNIDHNSAVIIFSDELKYFYLEYA